MWNISILDNIDFVEKTFAAYTGNVKSGNDDNNKNKQVSLFGKSDYTEHLLLTYAEIIQEFLKKESDNWSHETIKNSATDGCKVPLPNVVILRPGENPNCNANVHAACKMYFDDVGTENSDYIDVAIIRSVAYVKEYVFGLDYDILGVWDF
ncbi:3600_t:CDS:2 [Paraglomus occultum]|uniref:3600_t:CDS:1 n=1 Tax=Paraglomus occultum TaxID=144539 RepID=A0A9N9GDK8_9GLOM|nr:3600_t:CDS:2 [Paraglomus occultum]